VQSTRASLLQGGFGRLFIHLGMLCATLAFASWWTSHTILDTARTRRVTDAVLSNATMRDFVATKVASVTAPALGTPTLRSTAAPNQAQLAHRLSTVLDRSDVKAKLEQFVVDAHDRLIGKGSRPAVLDQATARTLVAAALPTLSSKDLARVHAVTFDVPRVGTLAASRRALTHRFWLYALGAVLLVALAIATTGDRRATIKVVGAWLVGISVMHLVALWIVPVVVLPHVTDNPWVGLIAAVARALGAGIVTGLVVLAAVGVALLLADRLVAPWAAPASIAD
jgi:hypothetical protein